MPKTIRSQDVQDHMEEIAEINNIDPYKEPIVIKLANESYLIGMKEYEDDKYNITIILSSPVIVPDEEYDPEDWSQRVLIDGSDIFQFENGYLVQVNNQYVFTECIYTLRSTEPYARKDQSKNIRMSILLNEESITMTTSKYLTLDVSLEEWQSLNDKPIETLAEKLLANGVIKDTYKTKESQNTPKEETVLIIDGQRRNVTISEKVMDKLMRFI